MLGLQTCKQGDVSLHASPSSLLSSYALHFSSGCHLATCLICCAAHQVGSVCGWWWPGNRANSSEGLGDEQECTGVCSCLTATFVHGAPFILANAQYALLMQSAVISHSGMLYASHGLKILRTDSTRHPRFTIWQWIGDVAEETWLVEVNHHVAWLIICFSC